MITDNSIAPVWPSLTGGGMIRKQARTSLAIQGISGLCPIRGRQGFTILEMLAALFILVLFLAPVLFFLQTSTRGIAINREDVLLHCASCELIEQLLSIPYEELPTGVFDDPHLTNQQLIGSSSWPFRISGPVRISRRLDISEVTAENRPRFKKIKVSLSLPLLSGSSAPRNFSRTVLYVKEIL